MTTGIFKRIFAVSVLMVLCVTPIYAQGSNNQRNVAGGAEKPTVLLPVGVNYSRDVKYSLLRGNVMSTAICGISNPENGNIEAFISTLAHVTCDTIRHKVYVDILDEEVQDWYTVDSYMVVETKEDYPGEPFTSILTDVVFKGQKPDRYYRARGTHLVILNGERESLNTYTDGLKITK